MKKTKWQRVPVVDLCETHVDCVNRTAPVVDGPTEFKMIRTTNVRNGFIDIENVRYVDEPTFHRWTRRLVPKAKDVILTREAPLGEVGMLRTNDRIFLGQRLYHFRPDPNKLDPHFLLYSLLGEDLQGQIRGFGSGSTVEHMRLGDIPELRINDPGIKHQRKIAGILSAYDDLIENNLRRIRILEEMAQSLYREWFVHFRFPGHESTPLVDSPLGPIPEGWEARKLGDLAEDVRRGIPKGELAEPTPYVGLEHIPRQSLALDDWEVVSELGSNKLLFEPDEILFGKIRPYFHKVSVAPFSGICSADTIVIRSKAPEDRAVVTACVSSEPFVAHASATANGAKMPRANWKVLVDFPLVNPPEYLKAKFSEFYNNAVDKQKTLIRRNQTLRQTRDLLLPKFLST